MEWRSRGADSAYQSHNHLAQAAGGVGAEGGAGEAVAGLEGVVVLVGAGESLVGAGAAAGVTVAVVVVGEEVVVVLGWAISL